MSLVHPFSSSKLWAFVHRMVVPPAHGKQARIFAVLHEELLCMLECSSVLASVLLI